MSDTEPRIQVKREPLTYEQAAPHSFFLDLVRSKLYRDQLAETRLDRHQLEMRVNPNTTAGTGGEFTPPLWLIDDAHVKTAARAGRTFADLLPNQLLPRGVVGVHVPKITVGTLDDVQTTEGQPVDDQDLTSSDINQSQVVTLSGQSDVSQQLFDLSPTGFDRWAYLDLNRSYNAQLENGLINGSGSNGQLLGISNFSVPAANTVAGSSFNSIALLWPGLGQAAAAITNGRLLQPEVWLMAGRRWFWIASSVDSQNRPIDTPRNVTLSQSDSAGGYPSIGLIDGIPVYLSGAITAGSVADNIYCCRPNDMFLFESAERYTVNVNPVSGTLQVRLQLYRDVAFVGNVYSSGLAVITGVPKPANF